jgi:hypothetical protein
MASAVAGLLGGLDDHRAASRQRARDLAGGRDRGGVPRRKCRDRTERLAHRDLLDGAVARRDYAAIGAAALLRIPVEDTGGGLDLDARFRHRLAEFQRDQARDLVATLPDQRCRPEKNTAAIDRRHLPPLFVPVRRRRQRFIEIGLASVRQLAKHGAGRRVEYRLSVTPLAGAPLAVDEKPERGIIDHERSPSEAGTAMPCPRIDEV